MRKTKRYGWVAQRPDHRDFKFSSIAPTVAQIPPSVDLRPLCPGVYDQGDLGSCTANAIAGAFEFDLLDQKLSDFIPSRLFIYFNERALEGDINQDNGAQIRDGMSSIKTLGVCSETDWPYDVSQFAVTPTDSVFQKASANKAIQYLALDANLNQLKACLVAGFPFVFGMSVFDSFESETVAQTGVVPMPGENENCIGGHAVMCVGYDDTKDSFLVRNSWGTGWGLAGYFWLPYAYLANMSDFWTLRSVV